MDDLVGVWVAALLTLGLFSFLYKDNPYFRFTEALFAGISLGYYIGNELGNTLRPNLLEPLRQDFSGNLHLLIPTAMGILLYARYKKSLAWLGKYSLAAYVGYYAGYNMILKLHGEVLPQIQSTILPLNQFSAKFFHTDLIILIGVLAVLVYFFFSKEVKEGELSSQVFAKVSVLGTWFLMVSFGAAFGYTVMARISLLIGRFNFLLNDCILGTFARF